MTSPIALPASNQFDVLGSPQDEGKVSSGGPSRFGKDDMKEAAFQAKEQIKSRIGGIKEQIVNSEIATKINAGLQQGIEIVKEKAGIPKEASKEQVVDELSQQAGEQWETVQRKGHHKVKKAVNAQLDANLTDEQRVTLDKNMRKAKAGAMRLERQADDFSARILARVLSGPTLRPVKNFIWRNHLQLPAFLFLSFISVWLTINVFRLVLSFTHPREPEFDIHSKEATYNWLKFHAGDFQNKALEMPSTLTGKAAAFLAHYDWEKLKDANVNWKDIALNKLGLREPTWGEWLWARLRGHPATWQERVHDVIETARVGLARADLRTPGLMERVKDWMAEHVPTAHVPTMSERAADVVDSLKAAMPSMPSLRAEPSTLDNIKSGAEYIKNRVVHGAQEAGHIAQDRTNEILDKAKYQTGL